MEEELLCTLKMHFLTKLFFELIVLLNVLPVVSCVFACSTDHLVVVLKFWLMCMYSVLCNIDVSLVSQFILIATSM